jgi:uncharacterized protein with FMN-binding domain
MKKMFLSMFVMISFGFYVIWQNVGVSAANFIAPAPVVTTNTTTKKTSKPVAVVSTTPVVNNPQPTPTTPTPVVTPPPPKKTGIYNDGTYIGSVADAYYGYVQVKAVITNSRLTDVIFLDYPQDRSTSIRINNRAIPILIQEAISAQSANVNGVSGASATSPAFVESLTSALNQAKV